MGLKHLAAVSMCAALLMTPVRAQYREPNEAAIFGVRVAGDKILFDVASNGCTDRKDFRVVVNKSPDSGSRAVTLVRLGEDECRMRTNIISIAYDLGEVGLKDTKTVRIKNLLSINPSIPRLFEGTPR